MTFDPVSYLQSLQNFGVKLGLERMQSLMQKINNPQNNYPTIHVAGTNGKGSVSAILASSLQSAGYKVGLYTSPHLTSFTERIQINQEKISLKNLHDLVIEIKQKFGDSQITFFEFTTAVAFEYFAKNNVDIAIIEVGLGGRLDATNVITPLVSAITNIDFDHTKILGESKEQIATEKAGIIKPNVPLFISVTDEKARIKIKQIAKQKNSPINYVFKTALAPKQSSQNFKTKTQTFLWKNEPWTISLLGKHQISNAILAIEIMYYLNENTKFKHTPLQLKHALKNTFWPARIQFISEKPLTLIDGAHNLAAINCLTEFLNENKTNLPTIENRILIFALSTGKDPNPILKTLSKNFSKIIITSASHRAQSKEELASIAKKYFSNVTVAPLENSYALAKKNMSANSFILITGSLYLIGDFLKSEQQRNKNQTAN